MKQVDSIADLRALLGEWHPQGDSIALVPTMGNLHKGHMSLVELAREHADRVIVSVFVNPTQFGPDEDFEEYPRTLETDAMKLTRAGADVLFAPSVAEMYPEGTEQATGIIVPGICDELEGASRPGHFAGVAAVVCRLLNICHPNVAVFGQKDYQQYVVLKRMVTDLHLPVKLVLADTARTGEGLALSSRNSYLEDEQQSQALVISRALNAVREALQAGQRDYAVLEQAACEQIAAAGLEPDYVSVRDAADLAPPTGDSLRVAVLAAAHLAGVRLIDNLLVELPG
jgi:pantoate--beta-alanine ligase